MRTVQCSGDDRQPEWYLNVVANPDVSIEVGTDTVDATARVAEADEREQIWSRQKQAAPVFADYEQKAAPREIPVIVIKRR